MQIIYDRLLANKKFEYEISREEFNRLMEVKKSADRYDRFGVKKVKISRNMDGQAIAKFGAKPKERIKSDYMKGPFAVVFFSTTPDLADADEGDHYFKQATMIVEEGEKLRVHRDSLNDGYTNAKFCDDTTMLMRLDDKDGVKHYFKVEGEPTCYNSWKFDQENETARNFFAEAIEKQWDNACKEVDMDKENVYIVIQLENV